MDRRKFLETSVAASIAASFPLNALAAEHRIERIGLQLYTVRGAMKSDFEGTIGKVAQIGYKEVEFAGYFDHSPKEIRAILEKDGLTAPSCHVGYDLLENKWPETLEAAQVVGHKYVVCPWIDEKQRHEPDGYKRAAELFNKAGEASSKVGIQFAYHNHNFEFAPEPAIGNKLPYDFLLENTDPKLVKMEMDLCWISVGGQDPLKYFKLYPGRFPLVHVKDIKQLPKLKPGGPAAPLDVEAHDLTAVGSGVINWKRIFEHSSEAGIQHYFVEQDFPVDSFDSIQKSYEYLKALRF
jgi:sugar phosphate isomerase/epimerase